jgi:hypothetical protein
LLPILRLRTDAFMPRFEVLRARTGRPHWVVADEAHHLMPASVTPREQPTRQVPRGLFFVRKYAQGELGEDKSF